MSRREWALLRRHESEDIFGVQVCGSSTPLMAKCAELLRNETDVDFVDINVGCPIDQVFRRGEGSGLMLRENRLGQIVRAMSNVLNVPLTIKLRTGIYKEKNTAHELIPKLKTWGVDLITVHGRTREQRYSKLADWDYIDQCAAAAKPVPLFGNGDIYSYEDAVLHREKTGVSGLMVARGALYKPWIFTEIKEERFVCKCFLESSLVLSSPASNLPPPLHLPSSSPPLQDTGTFRLLSAWTLSSALPTMGWSTGARTAAGWS